MDINISNLTDEQTRSIITQQNYLENEIDIDYECWRLKIIEHEFFEKFLWELLFTSESKIEEVSYPGL